MFKPGNVAPPSRTVARSPSLAMRLQRARFAAGGDTSIGHQLSGVERWHVGPIKSHVKGRTDHVPLTVPPGAYVIPADVISGLGQGNTEAGHLELIKRLGLSENDPHYSGGGGIRIMAAGGEHVISPKDVRRKGGGNIERGHDFLDRFVAAERKKLVKTLRGLPGPKKRD